MVAVVPHKEAVAPDTNLTEMGVGRHLSGTQY